ncbi:DUF5791 family protein [Halarchaeum nitratireducens]|uniref:Uncharacterized protein n=1 Tax=Halarchaeum nitratireducens TaxID=489913 RepID=A0A830GAS6_9EURY|nr:MULTISPECIES: DUF5791 family protein [Halarchaeum]MBP2251584.1 hypothetical protein [Halarchaeum solikamskense]GGN13906.1 hypothetical protein GCM10009021_12540 [Halarchaeum nitratireducens]
MLTEEIADPAATAPEALRTQYLAALTAVIEERGIEPVAAETDLSTERVEVILDNPDDVTLAEAAAVLSCSPDYPAADDYLLEVRDHLMLQMSSAVVDIGALQRAIDTDLDPKVLQQKVEGRREMTLAEYARVVHHLAVENPW